MDDIEEDLTCSVCYSLFCDPRVLSCSHTFCKACLDRLLQSSLDHTVWRPLRLPLKCPNCRSVMELPPTGVEALPVNVSLRAIVEKFQKGRPPRPPCCPDHRGQPLNVYCVQDRKLICGLCLTMGQHQGHSIDDLQSSFIRERQTPGELLAQLSDQRCAQVCELEEQLEQGKARCEGQVRADRLAIEHFFQGLELTLSKKKEAFLEALDAASTEVSISYDPLINRVKEMQEEHLDLVSLGSSIEDEICPLVFLDQLHLFRGRVEALMDTPLPSAVALSVSPRATEYLQCHWPVVTIGGLGDAPVPRVCCCAGCGNPEAKPENGQTAAGAAVWNPGVVIFRLCMIINTTILLMIPITFVILFGMLTVLVINYGDVDQTVSQLCQFVGLSSEMTTSILMSIERSEKQRLEESERTRKTFEDFCRWVAGSLLRD